MIAANRHLAPPVAGKVTPDSRQPASPVESGVTVAELFDPLPPQIHALYDRAVADIAAWQPRPMPAGWS